jgi:Domain of unknown function (DU1801)
MAELKTKKTDENVTAFLNKFEDEQKRKDCFEIIEMMKAASGLPPKMWGTSIIGFDSYHYKYESGHEGDMCLIGFSPRKQNVALYGMGGAERNYDLLQKLGKHKTGKGCLYINKLSDINPSILKEIIKASFDYLKTKYK